MAESVGRFVTVTTFETTGSYSYQTSAKHYLRQVKATLTFKREGKRVFPLATLGRTKIKILSLLESLDLEAERLSLIELGNEWYFQKLFGKPKVQDH